jgi:chemotaxis signal transduction protein
VVIVAEASFVHFEIGGDRLAVLLDEIREVARVSKVTPVPRADASVRGVANIRGRVVTLLDLDVLYARPGGAAPPREGTGHAVVLAPPRDNLALFTRSRVDIGRGEESTIAGEARQGAADPRSAPLGPLLSFRGDVVHLLPTAELAAACEARVLSRFRHR